MEPGICVIARAAAKPGNEENLRKVLNGMLSPTRAEDGCSFYRLFEAREPGLFYFYELWRDEAALNAHVDSVHFKEMQIRLKDLLFEPLEVSLVREIGAE
jgi:quinol monooxygenase YgiN